MRHRLLPMVTALGVLIVIAGAARGEVLERPQVPPDLASAATSYADALARGDTVAGWNLLSEASRREVNPTDWHRAFQPRSPVGRPPATALLRALAAEGEPPTIAGTLVRATDALLAVRATVPVTRTVVLVREKDGWRVDLRATDELNSRQSAQDFLAAVREDASLSQGRTLRQPAPVSMAVLRVMLESEARGYRVQRAELAGDRATVTLVADVPVNLVLQARRSGAGWAVDLTRPVVPVDPAAPDPLQAAADYLDRTECEDQLRQLVRGIQMYAASSEDMLPDPDRWYDQIRRYLAPGFVGHCPRDPRPGLSYAFNANLRGKRLKEIANPSLVPLLFESKLHTANPADTGQSWAEGRHPEGNLVAFVDGSIRPAPAPLSFEVTTVPPTRQQGQTKAFVPRSTPPRDRTPQLAP